MPEFLSPLTCESVEWFMLLEGSGIFKALSLGPSEVFSGSGLGGGWFNWGVVFMAETKGSSNSNNDNWIQNPLIKNNSEENRVMTCGRIFFLVLIVNFMFFVLR